MVPNDFGENSSDKEAGENSSTAAWYLRVHG